MRSIGSIPLALAALLAVPRAAADGPFVSSTSTAAWQDNVTFAPSGYGVRSALDLETGVDVTWIHSVDFSTLLTSCVSTNVDACTSYAGLDNLSVGPTFELRRRLGLGALAPVVSVGLSGCAIGFEDPERSKIEGSLLLGFEQRLSDSLQVVVGAKLGSFNARDIVFSGNYASADAALNWDLSETWRVKLSGGWRNGDAVSNYTAEESPSGWIPIDENAAYLPGAWHYVSTFHEPFVAYRVSTVTWSYGIGVSPALGPHTSLTLQLTHLDAPGIDRYVDNILSLSVTHQF
jgi:hypothetical protein